MADIYPYPKDQAAAALLAEDGAAVATGKNLCSVRGMVRPGAMCAAVITGGKYCGAQSPCEFKKPEFVTRSQPQPNEQIRLEEIDSMKDELAKIAVAVGRSKTDGHDCDWFELAGDVAALAAGVPKGWDVYRLGNSDDLLVVSPPDGSSVTLSPQGTGLASQLLYKLATTLMGGPKS